MSSNRPILALSIAPAARDWLLETQQAYILQAFDQVMNIANQEGSVLSLVTRQIGSGPFSVLLPTDSFPEIETAEPIRIFHDSIWVGDLLVLFSEAEEWNPQPDWEQVQGHEGRRLWAVRRVRELLKKHAQPESLSQFVLDPLATLPGPARMMQVAEQSIPLLYEAIQTENADQLIQAAKQLAGMGLGLTPAGDDLLVGAMLGVWATKPQAQAHSQCKAIANTAIPRTHTLSAAWLAAAARGEAAEPWHQLLAAIADENPEALQQAVLRILPTGHTSGADALGGFLGMLESS